MDRVKALFYIRSTKKPSRKNVVKNCLLVTLVFSWCANKYKVFNCNNMFCRVKTRGSECWFFILHQLSLKKVGGRKDQSLPLNLRVRRVDLCILSQKVKRARLSKQAGVVKTQNCYAPLPLIQEKSFTIIKKFMLTTSFFKSARHCYPVQFICTFLLYIFLSIFAH